jgi:O-antigen/teichoic acid export membrane protein
MRGQPYSVHRFRRALVQFVGGRLAQAAARAILVLLLIRVLPVEDYGAYMLIVGTAELLLQVGSFGILPTMQRYLPQLLSTLPLKRLFGFIGLMVTSQMAILGVVAYVLSQSWDAVAPYFGMTPAQIDATRVGAWLFLIVPAFRFGAEMLESMLAPGQIARALMVFARLAALVALLLLKPEVTLYDVVMIDVIAIGACVVLIMISIARTLTKVHRPPAVAGKMPLGEMARFAGQMALVGPMSGTSSPGALRLVLANGLGLAESGLFAFLQNLERLVSRYLPATLLRNLIRPVLISRYVGKGGKDVMRAGTGLLLKSNLLVVIAGVVVIAVCGDEIVRILSGGKFVGAGLTLLLLYVNMIATSQRGVQEMVMQITGHTRALWFTSMVKPVALLLVWFFAPHGLNVAVTIVAAGSLLSNALATRVLRRKTDWFRVDWRGTAAILLPGVNAAVLGILLSDRVHPLAAGAIALAVFLVFVRISRPFNAGEVGAVERVMGARATRMLRGFAA